MKILVSDFDYTFFTLDYLKNIEAAQRFVNNGNIFIIATGRNLVQILEEVKDFYVPYFFLICNDGATIYDRNNKILFQKNLAKTTAISIFNMLDKQKYISETFMDNNTEYSVSDADAVSKIIAKPKNSKKASLLLEKILNDYKDVEGYMSEQWLNIFAKGVSKGKALEILLNKFHLENEDIYVVGDNINDISMLQKYKGYVMKDAKEEVKKYGIKEVANIQEMIKIIEDSSNL